MAFKKGNVPWNKGKQFCPQGHDTFVVGRTNNGTCAICAKIRTEEDYKNNTEKRKKNYRSWRQLNPEKAKTTTKNLTWKRLQILNADGSPFTMVDYDRAYQIQQGCCGICKRHSTEFRQMLSADHDHKTSRFRGLLCQGCNSKLGIKEDLSWNTAASAYLSSFSVRI